MYLVRTDFLALVTSAQLRSGRIELAYGGFSTSAPTIVYADGNIQTYQYERRIIELISSIDVDALAYLLLTDFQVPSSTCFTEASKLQARYLTGSLPSI